MMRHIKFSSFLLLAALITFAPLQAQAFGIESTDFSVSVIAQDGLFIGSAMGGAKIIIRDRHTGDIIIEGVTSGGTGDAETLMANTRERRAGLTDRDTARFSFSLDLVEPMAVTIEAIGPQAMARVTHDMVLIPYKDYSEGDGIVLTLPGIAVKVLEPAPHTTLKHDPQAPVTVSANIMKLCGCRIGDDGHWPTDHYEVSLHIYTGAHLVDKVPMQYAGTPGLFKSKLVVPDPASYRLVVTAFDPVTKEGGMDSTTLILKPDQ